MVEMFHPSLTQAVADERRTDLVKAAATERLRRALPRHRPVPGTRRGR